MDKRLVNAMGLAGYLNLSVNTVYSWVWHKRVPYHKLGRVLRFDLNEIDKLLDTYKVKQNPHWSEVNGNGIQAKT